MAFPLALAALYAGVIAVERPSRRAQFAFLGFALFATLARVQFVVLPRAFLVAASLVDRKRVLRTQRLPLALFALPLLGALAVGPSHVLGYYSTVAHQHVGTQLRTGRARPLPAGARLGRGARPGALVALARPTGRTETAFALLAATFAAGLLFEAALYASNGTSGSRSATSSRCYRWFRSRSGSTSSTGAPAACRSRCSPRCSSRSPRPCRSRLTRRAIGGTVSPFLTAVFRLERLGRHGATARWSLPRLAAVAAAGAVLVSRRGGADYALGAALAFALVTSLGATIADAATAREVRTAYLPADPSWVDATGAAAT